MPTQNCVHLHARVVVAKPEFSVVDKRKVALVNELRNFRTVTSKVSSFKYSIPLQLNGGSEKHSKPLYHQAIIKKTRARARDTGKCGFKAKNPNRITVRLFGRFTATNNLNIGPPPHCGYGHLDHISNVTK